MTTGERLRAVLGDTYGGPALGYDARTGEFVLFIWYDAPVGMDEWGRGATVEACLDDWQNRLARRSPE